MYLQIGKNSPVKGFFAAGVDLLIHISFAEDPEEHNACQTCTKRADVNGQYIHPVGDNALDQQGNDDADGCDNETGCFSSETGFLLNGGDRSLIKVHQRGHTGQKDGSKEDNSNYSSAGHGFDQMRQVYE